MVLVDLKVEVILDIDLVLRNLKSGLICIFFIES